MPDQHLPALCWDDGTEHEYEMAFGYTNDGAVAALYVDDDGPFFIPIEVLIEAYTRGWHMECPCCVEDTKEEDFPFPVVAIREIIRRHYDEDEVLYREEIDSDSIIITINLPIGEDDD